MRRRKLTAVEVASVEVAKNALRMLPDDVIDEDVVKVIALLREAERHRTTDGKPWVEPQPEIGEGYRVATDADVPRSDIEYFSNLKGNGWFPRAVPTARLESSYHYRVPVDRIPTDEDAVGRPTVMVRDRLDQAWSSIKLIAVRDRYNPFVGLCPTGTLSSWCYCRFPYPGETP